MQPISITAISSISPLGISLEETWQNYLLGQHMFTKKRFSGTDEWVASLSNTAIQEIETLRNSDTKYKKLDNSVLFALYASRKAIAQAQWKSEADFGINIGSSRGATTLFEKYHSCSTALHSVLNGVAWLRSGMANKFLVGGSEAPLTPFTIAQMKALKIYAKTDEPFPNQALNLEKKQNTMILGEGASVACLENGISENSLAVIEGVGYATEVLKHNISISSDATCFQRSMKMALGDLSPDEVDVIVMHSPGTIKGDLSEYRAIKKVFCNKTPFLTTNKWKVGHTFGASGMLSVEMAILMLQHQKSINTPFDTQKELSTIKKVMINAVGFGGNAVSILLSK